MVNPSNPNNNHATAPTQTIQMKRFTKVSFRVKIMLSFVFIHESRQIEIKLMKMATIFFRHGKLSIAFKIIEKVAMLTTFQLTNRASKFCCISSMLAINRDRLVICAACKRREIKLTTLIEPGRTPSNIKTRTL